MTTATEPTTAELPERLYSIIHHHPKYGRTVPLVIPFPPIGFGLPVFGEREGVEEFVASPNFDIAYNIKEISLEQFIEAGEYPVDLFKEHEEGEVFYMIDPSPTHEWDDFENMGLLVPMRTQPKS